MAKIKVLDSAISVVKDGDARTTDIIKTEYKTVIQ